MVLLREYAGVTRDEVTPLIDAGLLREDTTLPHLLYSVTPAGREAIGEHNRDGIDHGPGRGDLAESSEHVLLVELADWLASQRCADPDHPAEMVVRYHQLDDGRVLDVACLDSDGNVCVAIEAERINNDVRTAAPADFDKLADSGAQEAIWVVPSLTAASKLTDALANPADDDPRVTRTYGPTSPTRKYRIDESGFTDIYTAKGLIDFREEVEAASDGSDDG
jgi:hypothetical protein